MYLRKTCFLVALSMIVCACNDGGSSGGGGGQATTTTTVEPNKADSNFNSDSSAPDTNKTERGIVRTTNTAGATVNVESVPGRVLVQLKPGVDLNGLLNVTLNLGATVEAKFPKAGLLLLNVDLGQESRVLASLRNNSAVAAATVDFWLRPNMFNEPQEFSSLAWSLQARRYLENNRIVEGFRTVENQYRSRIQNIVKVGVIDQGFLDTDGGAQYVEDFDVARGTIDKTGNTAHGFWCSSLMFAQGNNNQLPLGVNWTSPFETQTVDASFSALAFAIAEQIGQNGVEYFTRRR